MHRIIEGDCERIGSELGCDLDRLRGRTVLMTGFSGFVGTYISHLLLRANRTTLKGDPCKFVGVDNFIRGRADWVGEVARSPRMTVIDHDISQGLPGTLQALKVDYILHAASIASPTYYRLHPIETMDANVRGLRGLLDFALKQQDSVRGFLFFSSSEVYGNPTPENIPTPETYCGNVSFTGPRACYDEAKRFGETLCVNFHRVHGLPISTVRPFNNYGPGLKLGDRRVVPDFFRNVLARQDIALLSDGKPTRTFSYVADAVTGYLKVLLSPPGGEAFNIGADNPEISMRQLAEMVIQVSAETLGIRVKLRFQKSEDSSYLSDSPLRRCPDVSKARRLLGFNPRTTLAEGLRRTALWYLDYPGIDER